MNKLIKISGILMLFTASLMIGLTNNPLSNNNDLSLDGLITISSANAEDGTDPWLQCCIPCTGGVKFYCGMAGWEGCFTMPCGGGYC